MGNPVLVQPLQVDVAANYRPSPGQLAFHRDRYKIRERLLSCGTGGGKTYGAAYEVFDITMREKPSTFIIAGPDYPQLATSVYPNVERLLGRKLTNLEPLGTFNQTKKLLQWANGWEWQFATMDDPTSVEGVPEATGVWLNEARLVKNFNHPDGPWLNLTRRLRGVVERARYAIADTHSPTKGITDAFKPAKIDARIERGGRYEVIDCVDPARRIYQWGTEAAIQWGTLSRPDGERIISMYAGADAERIIQGRYARPSGVIYDCFTEKNLRAWNRRRPERWSYGIDLGWTHPAVLTVHAWYGDTVWTVKEIVLTKPGIPVIVEEIRKLMDVYGAGTLWVGYDVRAPEIVEDLRRKGVPAEEFRGGVKEGIIVLNGRLQSETWLIDAKECPTLVDCIRDRYEWKEGTREEPKKEDDDAPDSARYGIVGGVHDTSAGVW